MRRRLCDLRQPGTRGPDGGERAVALGGQRQSAQGRCVERGPDRRAAWAEAPQESGVGQQSVGDAAVHLWAASDGVDLAYHEVGQGRAVVLLHGLFSDARMNWI